MHFLKVFGCLAYIKNLRPHLSKLDDRGQNVAFIGYQDGSKAYRFYDPVTKRVHVSRDAVFDETHAGTEEKRRRWAARTPSQWSTTTT
jgi:hypothetical protein